MAYRVEQVNKKNGITYVYESHSYWDKQKKQSRSKRVCIGKIDPDTGAFIPSKRLDPTQAAVRDPVVPASSQVVGPTLVLDTFAERIGLSKILTSVFPAVHRQILLMAHYLCVMGGPLSHCEAWIREHEPSCATSLSSQRISELLGSLSADDKQSFFSKWFSSIAEHDCLCYNVTSISSYSELSEYIKWGHNRDREQKLHLNLTLLH